MIKPTQDIGHGFAVDVLADGPATVFDRINTVTVMPINVMSLVSVTELDVLNGANMILIGSEILQFTTATLQADGSYLLSILLRGRRGTENETSTHATGDRAVLLEATDLAIAEFQQDDLNVLKYYKAVTFGQPIDLALLKSLTYTAASQRPYSPVHIKGTIASDDWTVTWTRRTRVGGAWVDLVDVPLSETSEAYEVDILNAGAVVRTITATASANGSVVTPASQTAFYDDADQVADFGSAQTTLDVKIYQMSENAGRGFPGIKTL